MRSETKETGPRLIPAAQYVRMSDDGQQFSIENQKVAIQDYANLHGFEVVRTYADAGKSGIVLKHREALRELLQDVLSGRASYKAILVYDVSRWGRFPNNDEAAHYEFLCTNSGIPLHYCAELFANDATPSSSILKALKRSMAAEFSRELGEKVFRGKCRLAQMGFWVGGLPGYGYRRMLVSANGRSKQQLQDGECKSLTTDRIILVPGPHNEVECVRRMFSMVLEGHGATSISCELNRIGIKCHGRPWTHTDVFNVLKNPKYAGCNVWHRRSQRLRGKVRPVASEHWITKPGAFTPIIDQQTFEKVQGILRNRVHLWTEKEMLDRLKRLLKTKGRLSETLILNARNMPAAATLHRRLGSYRQIYKMVGYSFPAEDWFKGERLEPTMRLRRNIVRRITELFPDVTVSHLPSRSRSVLSLKDGTLLAILLAPMKRTQAGLRWLVHPCIAEREMTTLLCRLNIRNDRVQSYDVFSCINRKHKLAKNDPRLAQGNRLKSLSELLAAIQQVVNKQGLT